MGFMSHGPELLVLLLLALLIFGPKKLPEIGQGLGKGIREFKKHTSDEPTPVANAPVQIPAVAPNDVTMSERPVEASAIPSDPQRHS